MNVNDRTLDQYLFENRVSPTPEFSARIDAFCGQLQQQAKATATRIPRSTRKKRKAQLLARRILFAAACLLLVTAVSVLAIPSARAAVSDWISGWFSTKEYFGQERTSRTIEPTMESITRVVDGEMPVTITETGKDSFAKKMADEFGLRIDEVAFNGKSIYMTGWFTGQSGRFLLDWYNGGYVWNEVGTMINGNLDFILPDGTRWHGSPEIVLNDEMRAIMKEYAANATLDDEGRAEKDPYTNGKWQDYMEKNGIRFTMEANYGEVEPKPLSGIVEAKLALDEYYFPDGSDERVTLFKADLGTVSFDADAYKANLHSSKVGQSVTLSGIHRTLIYEDVMEAGDTENDYTVKSYNTMLDYSGATLRVDSIAFHADDTVLTISGSLPESWQQLQRAYVGHDALDLIFLIDGELVPTLFSSWGFDGEEPYFKFTRTYESSTIPPSAWAEAKTLTIIPYLTSPDRMSAVDNEDASTRREVEMLPDTPIYGRSNITMFSEEDTSVVDRMDQYAITLNLDVYR